MGKTKKQKGKEHVKTDTLAKWDEMLEAEFGASSMAAEWKPILEEMRECIDHDCDAKTALEALKTADCNEDRILKAIYQYCGGNPAQDVEAKEELRRGNEKIIETAMRLRRLARQIEKCSTDVGSCGIERHNLRAPEELRQFASILDKSAALYSKAPYNELASKRVSGRDAYLSELVEMVQNITKRKHYRELAELVRATLQKYASEPKVGAESLRKVVKGYRKRISPSARKKRTKT